MTQPITTYNILVTGAFSSGKTQFIKSISEIDVVSTEFKPIEPYSIAYDFGRLTVSDHQVLYFFANPGARRFEVDSRIVNERCLGFVMLVDSRRPETFREARSVLSLLLGVRHFPIVVAANKQDSPDAWSANDVRIALRVPYHIPVLPCAARNTRSVASVLIALYQQVLKPIEAL